VIPGTVRPPVVVSVSGVVRGALPIVVVMVDGMYFGTPKVRVFEGTYDTFEMGNVAVAVVVEIAVKGIGLVSVDAVEEYRTGFSNDAVVCNMLVPPVVSGNLFSVEVTGAVMEMGTGGGTYLTAGGMTYFGFEGTYLGTVDAVVVFFTYIDVAGVSVETVDAVVNGTVIFLRADIVVGMVAVVNGIAAKRGAPLVNGIGSFGTVDGIGIGLGAIDEVGIGPGLTGIEVVNGVAAVVIGMAVRVGLVPMVLIVVVVGMGMGIDCVTGTDGMGAIDEMDETGIGRGIDLDVTDGVGVDMIKIPS